MFYSVSIMKKKVVIIGGGSVGCETADYLAPIVNDHYPRNRDITVIEMLDEVMLKETGPARSLLVQRMMKKGVKMIVKAKVDSVDENNICYIQDGISHMISDADTLVFAAGYKVDLAVEKMLKAAGVTYYLIGDSNIVGTLKDAIYAGYVKGCEI